MGFAPLRRARLSQPNGDGIDWPSAKSLSFDLFPNGLSDRANQRVLAVTGTKKVIGKLGVGLGFGATDGVGSTDKAVASQFIPAVQRTYFVLAKLNSFGGGGFGRFFEDTTINKELFYVNSSLGLVYWRSFDTGQRTANSGSAASVSDKFGKVTAYATSFDASNPSNQPELYIDGVRYPFASADGVPSGSAVAYSGLCIGNRNSDNARGCDGTIYVVRSFDRMLSAKEHAELTANPNTVFL